MPSLSSKHLLIPTILAMATAQAASAGIFTVSPDLAPLAPTINAITYNGANVSGGSAAFSGLTANANFAVGAEYTSDSAGSLVWQTNLSTSGSVAVGLVPADDTTSYDYTSIGTLGLSGLSSNAFSNLNANRYAMTASGAIIGNVSRRYQASGATSNSFTGSDAWVYTPGLNTGSTVAGILTPTLVGPTTTQVDSNGSSSTYFFQNGTANATHTFTGGATNLSRTTTLNSIATIGGYTTAVGTASRYTGTTSSSQIGIDVFLATQSGGGIFASSDILLGLGVSTNEAGYGYTQTILSNPYVTRTSTLIATNTGGSFGLMGGRGINDNGVVAGISTRYNNTANSSTNSTAAGSDGWMYVSGTTYHVGLTGGIYESTVTANAKTRTTVLKALNDSNQVAGTSVVYSTVANTNGTSATNFGTQGWVYTYSGTPGTATGFGGNYVQVGLTDHQASGIGHATTFAQAAPYGVTSIATMNDSGVVAGTSNRYETGGTVVGVDAWVYEGSGSTINLQPNAFLAANPGKVITYQLGVDPTATGSPPSPAVSVPTVTSGTAGLPANANYISTVQTLNTRNTGMAVTAINANGWVAGSVNRMSTTVAPTAPAPSVGADGFVYNPSTGTEYILSVPSYSNSKDNYANLNITGLSDNNVVTGIYSTYNGATNSTLTAQYYFEWSTTLGFVTLSELYAVSATNPALYFTPNNALAGVTNPASFINTNPLIDSAGDVFIYGNNSPIAGDGSFPNGATANGYYEITVPEPASLGLLGMGIGGLMIRRGKRRGA